MASCRKCGTDEIDLICKDCITLDKTQVLISNKWYSVGYPECQGCPHLIITHGVCDFEKLESADCEYPDNRLLRESLPSTHKKEQS